MEADERNLFKFTAAHTRIICEQVFKQKRKKEGKKEAMVLLQQEAAQNE